MGAERVGDWIVEQLLTLPGVEERKSRFADKEALLFRGTEFFHLDEPGLADVRLGRQRIREYKDKLRSDHLVELRTGSSDWVNVRFSSQEEAARVLKWAKVAIGRR